MKNCSKNKYLLTLRLVFSFTIGKSIFDLLQKRIVFYAIMLIEIIDKMVQI